jgi:predicted transcriptional regulator
MSYYEQIIYDKLCDLHSVTRWYVRTSVVAGHLGRDDRSIRKILSGLESRGFIKRRNQRGGWMPTGARFKRDWCVPSGRVPMIGSFGAARLS